MGWSSDTGIKTTGTDNSTVEKGYLAGADSSTISKGYLAGPDHSTVQKGYLAWTDSSTVQKGYLENGGEGGGGLMTVIQK